MLEILHTLFFPSSEHSFPLRLEYLPWNLFHRTFHWVTPLEWKTKLVLLINEFRFRCFYLGLKKSLRTYIGVFCDSVYRAATAET